jgi:hypothetical protein
MPWLVKDYYDITKCCRCSKEIAENDFCIKVETSDPFRGRVFGYLCEKCYKEIKEDFDA